MRKTLLFAALAAVCALPSTVSAQSGSGTEADPYLISTADEFANAYKKVQAGQLTYFKQTADIDMAGVTRHTAFIGYAAEYSGAIYYDGCNHVIKNFAPETRDAINDEGYYCTSMFGVLNGTVKNLGVVDANVAVGQLEGGILGGFGGTTSAATEVVIENVYITGKIVNTDGSGQCGAFFGMSNLPLTMKNCFAQVDVEGKDCVGGLIGIAAQPVTLNNVYYAGTVTATGSTGLLVAGTKDVAVTVNNAVAFGGTREDEWASESIRAASVGKITNLSVVPANDSKAIAEIRAWEGFSATESIGGYPALASDGSAGIDDIINDENTAPVEYYNLNGQRVDKPSSGIHIKIQGNKVMKVNVSW